MATKDFKRKISAIFSADVAGYSRLMGEDEEETVRTLKAYREVMAILVREHRGRLIDSTGDNLLAEFASVVDALRCAWDIHKEIKARNSGLPEERRMVFRIGINLGDVIEEEERVYGDGVNVAARLESLAEVGGISISGTGYDQVKNKLPWQYEYQGEQAVKNITEPVRVYRVVMEPGAGVAKESEEKISRLKKWGRAGIGAFVILILGAITMAVWHSYFSPTPQPEKAPLVWNPQFELPGKPSIAVLPFANFTGDPEREYLCDGLAEELINILTTIRPLKVVARTSSFVFKGRTEDIRLIGKALDVASVLEGSVRRMGNQLRVTAQLINVEDGYHLWSERYDREMEDVFAIQDEIAENVASALEVVLSEDERRAIQKIPTEKL